MPKITHRIKSKLKILLIQAIDQSRTFIQSQFATTVDLANCLSDIFCNPGFAVKTQTGAMECMLTAYFGEDDIFLSIVSNCSIFIWSDKKDGKTNFSCIDNNFVESVNNLRNYSNDLSYRNTDPRWVYNEDKLPTFSFTS